jgi:hypothetical protein
LYRFGCISAYRYAYGGKFSDVIQKIKDEGNSVEYNGINIEDYEAKDKIENLFFILPGDIVGDTWKEIASSLVKKYNPCLTIHYEKQKKEITFILDESKRIFKRHDGADYCENN